MDRTSHEVAIQAIICGTLGFRASLEATEHSRATELCSRLLPWLEELGVDKQIGAFHREILDTSHGELSRESQTEAFWRGEAASLLGWAIQLLDKPNPTLSVDPGLLVTSLRILQPTAGEILSSAALRSPTEIDDYCAYCLTVRHHFQLALLPADAQATLSTIHQTMLAELGLSQAYHRLKGIEVEASKLAATTPSVKALYVSRALTAQWLLGAFE
jgi:hypothetical protein